LDQLEDERQFEPTEIERAVTSPDSNWKIIEEFKKHALEHEQRYGRFPKTLIFAANASSPATVRICGGVIESGDQLRRANASITAARGIKRWPAKESARNSSSATGAVDADSR
jgi:hypothetical protein